MSFILTKKTVLKLAMGLLMVVVKFSFLFYFNRLLNTLGTGEKFAIKVVLDRPKAVQEVQMHWKCCGHPHVVGIYQVFRNSLQFPGESESVSRLLLVLELMDGGELFYRISKQNGFTERQAAHTTMQVFIGNLEVFVKVFEAHPFLKFFFSKSKKLFFQFHT